MRLPCGCFRAIDIYLSSAMLNIRADEGQAIMQRQHFKNAEIYYIVGILCLVVSIGLFALSFYVLPNLAFGWHYSLPDFVSLWSNSLQEKYHLSEKAAAWFIFLGVFLPALCLAILADILSNQIERKVYRIEETKDTVIKSRRGEEKESNVLVVKIIVIIVLVFVAAQFFQWIISSSPQTL